MTPTPTSTRTPTPIPGPRPSPSPTAVSKPGAPGYLATCKDPAGDAEINDIQSISLMRHGDDLMVTWTVKSRVNLGGESVGFLLNLSSKNGRHDGQASVRFTNGKQSSFSTSSSTEATSKELDRQAEVAGRSVVASFPMADLAEFGLPFRYSAATTLDGEDLDACPDSDKKTGDISYDLFTG